MWWSGNGTDKVTLAGSSVLAGSAKARLRSEGWWVVTGKLGQYQARQITRGRNKQVRIPGKPEQERVREGRQGGDRVVRQENAGKSCILHVEWQSCRLWLWTLGEAVFKTNLSSCWFNTFSLIMALDTALSKNQLMMTRVGKVVADEESGCWRGGQAEVR